ncbi:MFS transporter [Candidatus Thorarchaeota archaeon]|jgi:UMF1 family MFS transporter|nr:MAG: MFS transporter [Candidatus Thorarchaeota archaeon]
MTEETQVKQVPTDKKERLGWYLYDFANTSFTVLIVTALFPIYFRLLVGNETLGDAMWGYAGSITMIVIALSAPVLGAIADYGGSKKKFMTVYTGLCIVFNMLMIGLPAILPTEGGPFSFPPFLGLDMWVWAWIIFIIANIGFQGALPFYNAWLPEISTEDNIGRIGGYGFAAGYVGAMLTIIIALVSTTVLQLPYTYAFFLSALFFLIFAIPSIRWLKNRPAKRFPGEEGQSLARLGYNRVRNTLKQIGKYQGLPLFLVAYFLFADAITTVIYYAAIFGQAVYGFDTTQTLLFFAVTQLAAIPGAFIFGWVADKIGTKKTLISTLFIWIAALLIAYLFVAWGQLIWWTVGMIAGVGMGSSQSTARSMYGQFIPEEKRTEMYGFYALTGKFAAILGPFVYGTILLIVNPLQQPGLVMQAHMTSMLAILLFFVVSVVLLLKVRQPVKGEAKVYLEDDIVPGEVV